MAGKGHPQPMLRESEVSQTVFPRSRSSLPNAL